MILKIIKFIYPFIVARVQVFIVAIPIVGVVLFIAYKRHNFKNVINIMDKTITMQHNNQQHISAIHQNICSNQQSCYTILISRKLDQSLVVSSVLYYTNIKLFNKTTLEQIDLTKLSQENCEQINCNPIQLNDKDLSWLSNTVKTNLTKISMTELQEKDSFANIKDLRDNNIYGYIMYPIYCNQVTFYYVGVAVNKELYEKNKKFFRHIEDYGQIIQKNIDFLCKDVKI